MPYSDKAKQRLYQKEWVRRKRGSTVVFLKPMGTAIPYPKTELSVTVSPARQPLTKERQLSRKGFNE